MICAISCFLVVHPGTVFPRDEKMPGLWGMIKGWLCCCRGRSREGGAEDGVQLVGKYEELEGEGRPPSYTSTPLGKK